MIRSPLRAAPLAASLLLAACGGGGGSDAPDATPPDADTAPLFRNPVDMDNDELALRALQILGADVPGSGTGCVPCHSLTESNIRDWAEYTNGALTQCLTDLEVQSQENAQAMIECIRTRSALPSNEFATYALGFWAAGSERDWWSYTFRKAFPEDGAEQWGAFVENIKMPPGGLAPLSDGDYDIVAEWFVRGVPLLDETLDEDPPPGECDALVTSAVGDHVDAMATTGWRAVNAANSSIMMFGCAGATNPRQCLTTETDAATTGFGADWAVNGQGVLRVLHTSNYASAYWTRGSADGRFIGNGAHNGVPNDWGAAIVDLQGTNRTIPVDAAYDPGFFPDNTGFVMQGGQRNTCAMSVLTSNPSQITMTEAGCSDVGEVGLYQHVGKMIAGGDYFAVDGAFVSDDGGHFATTSNPAANFGSNGAAGLIPMIFNGTTFQAVDQISVETPYGGDAVLSPSAKLLISRVSGLNDNQNGYSMLRVDATPDGAGGYTVDAPEIARYCLEGGKPAFSYDERWMVIHHYVEDTNEDAQDLGFVDRNDAGFSPYITQGAANIYLVELTTGATTRITNMDPGQYALFPYFRSDGWIYFQVRVIDTTPEYVVASEAALIAEGL